MAALTEGIEAIGGMGSGWLDEAHEIQSGNMLRSELISCWTDSGVPQLAGGRASLRTASELPSYGNPANQLRLIFLVAGKFSSELLLSFARIFNALFRLLVPKSWINMFFSCTLDLIYRSF